MMELHFLLMPLDKTERKLRGRASILRTGVHTVEIG